MNARERFHAVMTGEPVDRTLQWEMGYWGGAVRRWYSEGLPLRTGIPAGIDGGDLVCGQGLAWDPYDAGRPLDRDILEYFAMDEGLRLIPLNNFFFPAFKEEIIEDHGTWYVRRTDMGVLRQDSRDRSTVPKFLSWPVSNRDDWEQLKSERLKPTLEGRLPSDWDQLVSQYDGRTYPLAIGARHGFYGTPRYLLGDERILTTFYDEPDLMRDMIDYLGDFWAQLYDQVLTQTSADVALIWEDMCYKVGPLISPAMFREFLLPAYKKLTGCLRDHGVNHILVDTDGDCWELIDLFLEAGVTGLYPFEVNAGMDVVEVRKAFPTLQILGGLDKVQMAKGAAEIDAELTKAQVLVPMGRYIPYFDHVVPMDIPWDNFKYYRRSLDRIILENPVKGTR